MEIGDEGQCQQSEEENGGRHGGGATSPVKRLALGGLQKLGGRGPMNLALSNNPIAPQFGKTVTADPTLTSRDVADNRVCIRNCGASMPI